MCITPNVPHTIAPTQHLYPISTMPVIGSIPLSAQVSEVVRAREAREIFALNGSGLTVAVLDTGLRTTHIDFTGRVLTQVNFTNDNAGNPAAAGDGNGHGTNVTGIIAANGRHVGIAPNVNIIPIKVLPNVGRGDFTAVCRALKWVIEHRATYNISAVCMSLGDGGNYAKDSFEQCPLRPLLKLLKQESVAVVAAAGNDFFAHQSKQGMGYPAILQEIISVGAVYDEDIGQCIYPNGAVAFSTGTDYIAPFSQRLHEAHNPEKYTELFAPGAAVSSSGVKDDYAQSTLHGTSQAAPVATGVILLMQEYYRQRTNTLPSIAEVVRWLRHTGTEIFDGDDENDNVDNTRLAYVRLDALNALKAIEQELGVAAM